MSHSRTSPLRARVFPLSCQQGLPLAACRARPASPPLPPTRCPRRASPVPCRNRPRPHLACASPRRARLPPERRCCASPAVPRRVRTSPPRPNPTRSRRAGGTARLLRPPQPQGAARRRRLRAWPRQPGAYGGADPRRLWLRPKALRVDPDQTL